jgi:hypothetical protein
MSVVIIMLALGGCGPELAELRSDPSCRTWVEGPFGNIDATVVNGEGFTHGPFGVHRWAFLASANEIDLHSLFGSRAVADYDRGSFTLHGVFSNYPTVSTLGATTQIPGGFSPLTVEHNRACRPEDTAVGAVTLFFAIQSAQQSAAAHH